jgi:hypothetical protein
MHVPSDQTHFSPIKGERSTTVFISIVYVNVAGWYIRILTDADILDRIHILNGLRNLNRINHNI